MKNLPINKRAFPISYINTLLNNYIVSKLPFLKKKYVVTSYICFILKDLHEIERFFPLSCWMALLVQHLGRNGKLLLQLKFRSGEW